MNRHNSLDSENTPPPKTWRAGYTLVYNFRGLIMLFGWMFFGDVAGVALARTIGPISMIMLKDFGVSNTVMGLLNGSIPTAIGLLVVPVLSYRSDRCRSRFGRRIPYLAAAVPLITLAMVSIGLTPVLAHHLHAWLGLASPGLTVCFLCIFSPFWLLFELTAGVGGSMFGALISDVVPDEVIGRFNSAMRIVSLAGGIGFNYFLMGTVDAHYAAIFIVVGVLYGIGYGMICLRVREGDYPPVPPGEHRNGLLAMFHSYRKECYSHPFYLVLFIAGCLAGTSSGPINNFGILYARSLGVDSGAYGKIIAYSFIASLVAAYPIGLLADRFHPLRICIGVQALYLAVSLWGWIYGVTAPMFTIAFIGHIFVSGMFVTASMSSAQRLFPKGKFAQLGAAGGLISALFGLVISPLVGMALDWVGSDYRYAFLIGGVFAALGLVGQLVVLRYYKALGGDAAFVAP